MAHLRIDYSEPRRYALVDMTEYERDILVDVTRDALRHAVSIEYRTVIRALLAVLERPTGV